MTTKITSIRNSMLTLVAASLDSDYKRMPNAYSPNDNAQIIIDKGWGLTIGPGERFNGELCNMEYTRLFNVIMVRLAAVTEHEITRRDDIEAALLEDMQAIRLKLERDNQTLDGNAIQTDYVNDSGIEFLVSEGSQFKFYSLNVTFSVLYKEVIA